MWLLTWTLGRKWWAEMNVTCLTGFHGSPASPRCGLHALDLMFSGLRETELVFLPRQGQFAVTLLFALGFFFLFFSPCRSPLCDICNVVRCPNERKMRKICRSPTLLKACRGANPKSPRSSSLGASAGLLCWPGWVNYEEVAKGDLSFPSRTFSPSHLILAEDKWYVTS